MKIKAEMNMLDETVLKGKSILVVDDETDLREIVSSELEYMGATIYQAPNVESAKETLKKQYVDLVVSDIRMPGGTGMDLLKFVKSRDVNIPPMILITGFADITTEDAFNNGAEALLSKPFKLDELVQTAARLTEPLANRFKDRSTAHGAFSVTFKNSMEEEIRSGNVSFGRGGMFLVVELARQKCEMGEVIKFHAQFKDMLFEGAGICRWWKPRDTMDHATMGLEFVRLSDQSLERFLTQVSDKKIVPFIPALT